MENNPLTKINKIFEEKSYVSNREQIVGFFDNDKLTIYFFEKLPYNLPTRLQNIDFLLNEMLKRKILFPLDKILELSVSKENNKFILDFIIEHYNDLVGQARDGLFQESGLEIVKKILETDSTTNDQVFILVKKILDLRGNTYKKRSEFNRERDLVADLILLLSNDETMLEELVFLAEKSFDLIEGGFGILMGTPAEVYTLLKRYLNQDIKIYFPKVVDLIVEQFQKEYKGKFDGWEWGGGGVSRAGSHFSQADRHFIELVLSPVLLDFYTKTEDFDFIKNNCITEEKLVSARRPDFLNRAVLPIILERYQSVDTNIREEAYKILKEFIESKEGFPSKSSLIYQALRDGKFSNEQKWSLAHIDAEQSTTTPTSVFLDQIITDLAASGHKEAKIILEKWQQNQNYYDRFYGFTSIATAVTTQLDNQFESAVKLFKDFIKQDGFTNDKFDQFEVYELARVLSRIIMKDTSVGLEILKYLESKPTLGYNEQILLCNGISNIDGKDTLNFIYEKFVDPFLKRFENDSRKMEKKFIAHANAREQFIEFAERLVNAEEIQKALRIVEVFMSDSDPYLPKDDPKGEEYNEHARIEHGQGDPTITSVRGRCAWVLMNCAILNGRNYIDKIIDLTEQLTKDENYYVQHMSCFALSQLSRIRLTRMPEIKELFLDSNKTKALQKSKRIEKIAFNLLERMKDYSSAAKNALAKSILTVFANIRSLNQVDALKLVSTFANNFPSEAIVEAASLFIFFAEFRVDAYKDKNWEWREEGLYDDLEEFNPEPFKKILQDLLQRDVIVRQEFAFKFSALPDDSEDEKAFSIALKYLEQIISFGYNQKIFDYIYTYFISKQLTKHFRECYVVWKKCIIKEIEEVKLKFKDQDSVPYWMDHTHDKVLLEVKQKIGTKQFLDDLNLFMEFPLGIYLYGVKSSINLLKEIQEEDEKVEKIYNKLIERDPSYYDEKQEWLRNK